MPETRTISCGGRPCLARARSSAASTPKSPQPGHQTGCAPEAKSLASKTQCGASESAAASCTVLSVSSDIAGDLRRAIRQGTGTRDTFGCGRNGPLAEEIVIELRPVVLLDDDDAAHALQRACKRLGRQRRDDAQRDDAHRAAGGGEPSRGFARGADGRAEGDDG